MQPLAESDQNLVKNTKEDKKDEFVYFPVPLRGEIFNHGRRLRLLEPFIFQDDKKKIVIAIPAGFESDYNSVPRGLWNLFPPWEYPEAAVIHDWLYKHPQGLYQGADEAIDNLSRRECDDIHRRILDLLGANWATRQLMWAGIRAGGEFSWKRYRNDPTLSDSGRNEPKESQAQPLPSFPSNSSPILGNVSGGK